MFLIKWLLIKKSATQKYIVLILNPNRSNAFIFGRQKDEMKKNQLDNFFVFHHFMFEIGCMLEIENGLLPDVTTFLSKGTWVMMFWTIFKVKCQKLAKCPGVFWFWSNYGLFWGSLGMVSYQVNSSFASGTSLSVF